MSSKKKEFNFRPEYHYSVQKNWLNDPNGLIYHNGEYHMFYQYHPGSTDWGPMHWGHAISKDLVSWESLGIALKPDENGMCFSGSAVKDPQNTTDFFEDKNGLVAIYTNAKPTGNDDEFIQEQSLAYSRDNGRIWEKYKDNPVISTPGFFDFRDPKVFWNEDNKKWIMLLAAKNRIEFYGSKNLKDWNKLSEFGKIYGGHDGVWECPELFKFKIGEETVWVLKVSVQGGSPNGGSGEIYFVGEFNGTEFNEFIENNYKWLDMGRDIYASQVWSNTGDKNIILGWMSNFDYGTKIPTGDWRGLMTFPRELSLDLKDNNYILKQFPHENIKKYRDKKNEIKNVSVNNNGISKKIYTGPQELIFKLNREDNNILEMKIGNDLNEYIKLVFDYKNKRILFKRDKSGIVDFGGENFGVCQNADFKFPEKTDVRILIDNCSVEVFINGGEIVFSNLVFPRSKYDKMEIFSKEEMEMESIINYKIKL